MPDWILQVLDYFFLVFHTLFTAFNALGWSVKKWRKWNLICLLLTGGSWFILGIFYGMGYCPFTDWHWQVLRELGQDDLPYSYIQYLLERVFYLEVSAEFANTGTIVVFFVALAVSIFLNITDYYKNRNTTT